jgi:hypothetical protein
VEYNIRQNFYLPVEKHRKSNLEQRSIREISNSFEIGRTVITILTFPYCRREKSDGVIDGKTALEASSDGR